MSKETLKRNVRITEKMRTGVRCKDISRSNKLVIGQCRTLL